MELGDKNNLRFQATKISALKMTLQNLMQLISNPPEKGQVVPYS